MKYAPRDFVVRIGMAMFLTLAAPAFAETPITSCPFTINTPGNYVLNADLTCGTTGIVILASNVNLKLNGHKITAPAGLGGLNVIGVGGVLGGSPTPVDHVGIQGPGLITGPSPNFIGIYLTSASYSQVSQVTIEGAVGIEGGIVASGCNFLTVTSNVIGHSGGGGNGGGVILNNTNSSSVTGNDTSGNGYGIEVSGGSGNSVTNNIANGNSSVGIALFALDFPRSVARVSGNVTNGNGSYGIYNAFAISQAFNNTAKANGSFDLFDQDACSGSWSDNVFFTANAPCIH